jgi:hypothetical protein
MIIIRILYCKYHNIRLVIIIYNYYYLRLTPQVNQYRQKTQVPNYAEKVTKTS